MAKRKRTARRPVKQPARQTSWRVIGGVIVAALVVVALLALALREPELQGLADYCRDNPNNCIAKGAADAPVTIVELSDYACSHCRDFNLDTAGLIEDLYVTPGDVRWVVLPFALSTQTIPVTAAAMCSNEQGRFFEYHKRLFETQAISLERTGFTAAAQDVGLDMAAFNSCVDSNRYQSSVQANLRAARLAGVNATPTFFVNGKKVEGNRPLPIFQQEIISALEDAGAG
jgi:protein-disulfide isomerase